MGLVLSTLFGLTKGKSVDSGYASSETGSLGTSPKHSQYSVPKDIAVLADTDDDDVNAKFTAEIRGKVLTLHSSMVTMFSEFQWPGIEWFAESWTKEQTETYARLRHDTHAIIHIALAANPERLQGAKACEFALFNFLWYPSVGDYEILWTASLLTLWLFIWDDHVDSNEGDLAKDFARACVWRKATVATAKQVLGLDDAASADEAVVSGPMVVLAEFGRLSRKRLNREQLQRIYDEIVLFVDSAEVEQAQRLEGYIPASHDEYIEQRLYSSAVYPCFFGLELLSTYRLPAWVWETQEMKIILREGNYLISVHNDILSLKKELVNCCLINVVPVLYHAGIAWDDIMPYLDNELKGCCRRLDEAAEALLKKTESSAGLTEATRQLIDGVRTNTTGNLGYSLLTPRYKCPLKNSKKEDGSIAITL
ncbi:isoprenoid synthase domain-containing protein [Podospora aff. communis PSN243]|uniref:Terpene synthase n=1 Tax=Podospora aff. communis PSN243 TaxID=3040156 RepID=A0AAV9GJ47_9PEZI|nr:isoprenoid synthase domain-containing protein [Podospora aff. communis PSN243]